MTIFENFRLGSGQIFRTCAYRGPRRSICNTWASSNEQITERSLTHSDLALFTTHGHKLGIEDDTYYEYSLEQRKDRAWMDDGFIL